MVVGISERRYSGRKISVSYLATEFSSMTPLPTHYHHQYYHNHGHHHHHSDQLPPYYHHHHNHHHIAVTYNCNYVPSNVLRVKGPLLAGALPKSWAEHRNFWGNFESFREGLPFPFVLFLLVIFLYV